SCSPVLCWMAHLFGCLNVCRWLHPWAGLLFFGSMAVMFVHWLGEMRLEPKDREWLRPRKVVEYMRYQGEDPDVGKYNGGQKLFFFAAGLGALGLLLSGVVMWFPLEFPRILRELAILIHDVAFIRFLVAAVFYIYLRTLPAPESFHSIMRG